MPTSPETLQYVLAHLDEDMELMARLTPCPITPSLATTAAAPSTAAEADHVLLLQVVHVEDVSLSLRERLQAVLPDEVPITSLSWDSDQQRAAHGVDGEDGVEVDDDPAVNEEDPAQEAGSGTAAAGGGGVALATLQASEAAEEARYRKRYGGSGPWRCLRFLLSDGFTRILAVEDRRATAEGSVAGRGPPVLPSGLPLGSKIKVSLNPDGAPCTTGGIVRLHRGNTTWLGGEVRALQVLAEEDARQRLEAMTGRPSKALGRHSGGASDSSLVTSESKPTANGPHAGNNAAAATIPVPVVASITPSPQPHVEQPPPPPSQQPQQQQHASLVPRYASLPVKSLEEWDAHVRDWAGHPFRTRAVITEVVSDMLLNEYPHDMAGRLLPTTLACVQSGMASGTQPTSGEVVTLYSLLVQLSVPSATAGASQNATQAGAAGGPTLIVDLGHVWLLELVGMPPRMFRALSEAAAHDAQQAARLQGIIERVAHRLETLGTITLVVQQRPLDEVVEVVCVEPTTAS